MVNSSLVLIEITGCQGGKLFIGKCGMVIKKKSWPHLSVHYKDAAIFVIIF